MSFRFSSAFLLLIAVSSYSQDSSSLTGSLIDSGGTVVAAAKLTLTESARKTPHSAVSNDTGLFSFTSLPPGEYELVIVKEGFKEYRVNLVRIGGRDHRSLRLQMTAAAAGNTSGTVLAAADGISTEVSIGSSMNESIAKELPINGRTVQSIGYLAPGVASGASPDGVNSSNGINPSANYYTVDGVAANTASGSSGPASGGGPFGPLGVENGGSGSRVGRTGTGQSNLIAMDAMEELRVQISPILPEYGRTPGTQVSITSRSGSNAVHGSAFGYFRNDSMNANDWFANRASLARGAMHQHNFGASLGGSLVKNRTFFFVSYEQNNISTPQTTFSAVPNRLIRATATAALRPFLNAFPLPIGPAIDAVASEFSSVYSAPAKLKFGSARFDQKIKSSMNVFLRYAISPSNLEARGSLYSTANTLTRTDFRNETLTGGWFWQRNSNVTNDLRINYTRGKHETSARMDNLGGAATLDPSLIFPSGVSTGNGSFNLQINGLGGYALGQVSAGRQEQINLVDGYSKTMGSHQIKLGFDYRRLTPTLNQRPYSSSYTFNGLGSNALGSGSSGNFLSGLASHAIVSSNTTSTYPLYQNFSTYLQDIWKFTDRTTFSYGVRWDVNPAPTVRSGAKPYAVRDDSSLVESQPSYATVWYNFSPRFGLAYQLNDDPNKEMILRAGVALIYDMSYNNTFGIFNGAPYSSVHVMTLPTFPLSSVNLAAPVLPAVAPFGQITVTDNQLLPGKSLQWHGTVERYFGRNQSLELGYVGSQGRRLPVLQTNTIFGSPITTYNDATLLRVVTTGAISSYHGLNTQFRRRFTGNMVAQVNYTWSHSIDTVARNLNPAYQLLVGGSKGNSDFDVRHNINASGSYRIPGTNNAFVKSVNNNWWLDFTATYNSGLPLDILTQSRSASTASATSTRIGFFGEGRSNYLGLPAFASDNSYPGGKRLNRAAFAIPASFSQGNLGRNALKGFDLTQLNLALRRDFAVREHLRIQLRFEAYNILNHPSFANPEARGNANYASSNFGLATQMAGGSNPYASGGPRTMQAVIRFDF